MSSISFRNLNKFFGKTKVLDDISFEVADEEIFCIIGPSGSGKTTLLRIVAGLETPTDGALFFGKKDVTNLKPNLRNIGMVFQDYALWPHLNVYKNISIVMKGRGKINNERETIEELLGKVNLTHKIDSKLSELSGGEMQRVALVRALSIKPDILLMDEPLSNLDAKIKRDFTGEMVKIIREEHITTLFVTHAQEEAYDMAERIAVLNKGVVDQIGSPEDVYLKPSNAFVSDFMSESITLNAVRKMSSGGDITFDTIIGDITFPDNAVVRNRNTATLVIRIYMLELTTEPVMPSIRAQVVDHKFNMGENIAILLLPNGRVIKKIEKEKVGKPGDTVYLRIPNDAFFMFDQNI